LNEVGACSLKKEVKEVFGSNRETVWIREVEMNAGCCGDVEPDMISGIGLAVLGSQ
jgi:hypothetical protein